MSHTEAPEQGANIPTTSRRANVPAPPTRRVISEPNIPVVMPARVADDERFLRWLDYAKEALPANVDIDDGPQPEPAPKAPAKTLAKAPRRGRMEAPTEELKAADKDITDIPEAIVMKGGASRKTGGKNAVKPASLPPARPAEKPNRKGLKNLAGEVPRSTSQKSEKRAVMKKGSHADKGDAPLDTSRFISFDDYTEGQTRIAPLKRGNALDGQRGLQRPKFLDGKLPRSVERGVLHPQPARLVVASLLLLLSKLLLIAVVIVFPTVAIMDAVLAEERHYVKEAFPLLVAFVVIGLMFISVANKARCRVCSCHFFFVRRCHKHKSAHRLPLVGQAGTAALHLLVFKWMRCMYCGTAIRLRGSTGVGKPSKDGTHYVSEGDEGEEGKGAAQSEHR